MLELLTTILIASSAQNVDPYLVAAVVQVESQFNANRVGDLGEIGLMQLRPEYFSKENPQRLFNPRRNIEIGVRYLKEVQAHCKYKSAHTFVVCYNAGITGGSRLLRPKEFAYYLKIDKAYSEMKSDKVFEKLAFLMGYNSRKSRRSLFLSGTQVIPLLDAKTHYSEKKDYPAPSQRVSEWSVSYFAPRKRRMVLRIDGMPRVHVLAA
jgi:hypothetical protein